MVKIHSARFTLEVESAVKRAQMDKVDMLLLSGLLHFLTFEDRDKPINRLGQGWGPKNVKIYFILIFFNDLVG